jgi:hypothetical protein
VCYISHPPYASWFDHPQNPNFVEEYKSCSFLETSLSASLSSSNIVLSTLNICSSLNVSDQFSHPYKTTDNAWGPFAKFVDSPYYSEWRCGDGLFLKCLPWQAMHFLQRSTPFSKTCCMPLITSKFLASELLFMVGKAQKSHGARSELNSVFVLKKWIGGTPLEHPPYSLIIIIVSIIIFDLTV